MTLPTPHRRVPIERRRLFGWRPYGRHGTQPRTMPMVTSAEAEVAMIVRSGATRVFLSEIEGAHADGHYRFLERPTSALNPDWRHLARFADDVIAGLLKAGVTPVKYLGCPRYAHEYAMREAVLGGYDERVEFAFDGAAGREAGSLTHRLIEELGPKRCWVEALPWKQGGEHWRGMRVVQLAANRMATERFRKSHRGLGTGPMDDTDFAEVCVVMTGHADEYMGEDGKLVIDKPTDRHAQRWARLDNVSVAIHPFSGEPERYAREVFEVVG